MLLAGVIQEGTVVGWIGCLIILAVCNWVWCKRAMLGFDRRGVRITGELFHDISGHGEVNISIAGAVLDNVVSFSPERIVEVL